MHLHVTVLHVSILLQSRDIWDAKHIEFRLLTKVVMEMSQGLVLRYTKTFAFFFFFLENDVIEHTVLQIKRKLDGNS